MKLRLLIVLISICMLITSYSLEYGLGLSPCIICELQRLVLYPITFLAACNVFIKQGKFAMLACLANSFAAGVAVYLGWHHVRLVSQPNLASNTCLPKLFTIIDMQGIPAAWQHIIAGGPACSKIHWSFLSLNLAQWSLIAYVLLFILIIFELSTLIKNKLDS